ncbi:MAG: amidinotransferase [Nitrospirae bacterium]|nr:amidinotransferase [Nitrospirota bacterium]
MPGIYPLSKIQYPPPKNALLMCPPDYYRIEYEINPWMSLKNQADTEKARNQWNSLYRALTEKFGLKVNLMEPQPQLPDLVFTANGGLVAGRQIILSNFKFPERQRERDYFKEWFLHHQYEIISIPSHLFFEGEGDALWMGKLLFAGHPFRTDISSHVFLSKTLQCEVISLELIDPRFYHLDTCFCPLNSETALFVPEAFSSHSRKILSSLVETLIPLKPEEGRLFVSNAIVFEKKIIFQSGAGSTRKRLEAEGFEVYSLDLSEFIKAGGNAKCLVLWV